MNLHKKRARRPKAAPEEPLSSLSRTPPKQGQQQLPACQVPCAVLGTACWPHDPSSNTATDGLLSDADVKNMTIPSCA